LALTVAFNLRSRTDAGVPRLGVAIVAAEITRVSGHAKRHGVERICAVLALRIDCIEKYIYDGILPGSPAKKIRHGLKKNVCLNIWAYRRSAETNRELALSEKVNKA